MSTAPPRVFVSYSWTSEDHQSWVLDLAERLVLNGVDVVIDEWNLQEGQDKNAFMESMVADKSIGRVLVVCDSGYKQKADSRSGGVGTESQIISPEVYRSTGQTRFIPVVAERDEDGVEQVPIFMKDRLYVDLSNPDTFHEQFENLLRILFDAPRRPKPPLGRPPTHLLDRSLAPSEVEAKAQLARDALRSRPQHIPSTLHDLLDAVDREYDSLRIIGKVDESDFFDHLERCQERLLPVRDATIETVDRICIQNADLDLGWTLHDHFERSIRHLHELPDENVRTTYNQDGLAFGIWELFLHLIALLVRHDRRDDLRALLHEPYFARIAREQRELTFTALQKPLRGINELLNARTQSRRASLSTDWLKDRCPTALCAWPEVQQADLIAFLSFALHHDQHRSRWWPSTMIYSSEYPEPYDLFFRATSDRYFSRLAAYLNVHSREDLRSRYEDARVKVGFASYEVGWHRFHFDAVANMDRIAPKTSE